MGELVHVRAVWGCLGCIMNTPTDDMNDGIKGSVTWLDSYSVQTIYVTAVNLMNGRPEISKNDALPVYGVSRREVFQR